MAWRDATRGQSIVILVNAFLRAFQLIDGVLGIFYYANEKGYWLDHGLPSKINYEFVLGVFAILTGLALGLIPFKMSYRPVALACPWDFIMFLMYAIAFGQMRAVYNKLSQNPYPFKVAGPYDIDRLVSHGLALYHKNWFNLASMLLFLISAIMGAVMLWMGRKTARGGKHSAV